MDAATHPSQALKDRTRAQWDRCAAGWNEHTPAVRAWLRSATDAMLDMAGLHPGDHVLDVAAGSGDQALDIARRVGPDGRVVATDLSPGILEFAQANAAAAGLANVSVRVADGEDLPFESATFNASVSRLGLMLFPDPGRAVREFRRVVRPGGAVVALVFAGPERNPCVTTLLGAALEHAGLPRPDPWQPGGLLSLGRPGQLESLFRQAGLRDVSVTAIDAPFRLPSAAHYLDFIRSAATPVQAILSGLAPEAAQAAWRDMESRLARFDTAEGWEGPNELLLAFGRH